MFAIKRGFIQENEINCNPLYPFYIDLLARYKASPLCRGIMKDYLLINPRTNCSDLTDESLVSFIPMTNVQEKNNCVQYDLVKYEIVKKGFTVFQRDDLIWAKITPCMQNGKSCVVSEMPTEIGFGSTEFHVIRKRNEEVYMPFIWAIFSNDDVLKAAQAVFGGSAGQQRVSATFLERFPAVLPDYKKQVEMVKNLENKLCELNERLEKAKSLLSTFEATISDECGLTRTKRGNYCFAIPLKRLDGVINVKRYASIANQEHSLKINDVCHIVEQKINANAYRQETIDWIRIDDLENYPLDIEIVRTLPADEVDGSFFKVQTGDILVARLGPTILNQKIVMVRNTERETIASSEFLVLRTKDGYAPEAIMAVLKTEYYKDLMYAHARGSTPSRYRLNREDMLNLPFPDIKNIQISIGERAMANRLRVTQLRTQAKKEWVQSKTQFQDELLGGARR